MCHITYTTRRLNDIARVEHRCFREQRQDPLSRFEHTEANHINDAQINSYNNPFPAEHGVLIIEVVLRVIGSQGLCSTQDALSLTCVAIAGTQLVCTWEGFCSGRACKSCGEDTASAQDTANNSMQAWRCTDLRLSSASHTV